jgi:hypothetical protein
MMRDPVILTTPGTRIRLPSGNVVEVTGEVRDGIGCVYRRHAGSLDEAHVGVTLLPLFLERWGTVL